MFIIVNNLENIIGLAKIGMTNLYIPYSNRNGLSNSSVGYPYNCTSFTVRSEMLKTLPVKEVSIVLEVK